MGKIVSVTLTVVKSPMEPLISPLLTAPVRPFRVAETSHFHQHTRALVVLKRNLHSLLAGRKESQVALARHVRHSKAWINKFLNDQTDTVEIQIKDVDRIASFFGIEPYQLFQPGISALTERRLAGDRRANTDRRVGHKGRELAMLRAELDKLPAVAHGGTAAHTAASDPTQRAIDLAIQRFAREIHALQSGRQAPTDGPNSTRVSKDRRKHRRAVTKPA